MNKSILAVFDLEEEYVTSLMDYLGLVPVIPFEIHAFTKVKKLIEYAQKNKIDVLLIAETAVFDSIENLGAEEIFVLSEEKGMAGEERNHTIYKYQSADNILREVMCYYAEVADTVRNRAAALSDSAVEIIGVYSPVKRALKTSFALTLGQLLAKKKRTLYINLEEYSGFNTLLRATYMTDMSDLMYYISQNKHNFIWKLASMVQHIGKLDYIPPALSTLDIKEITSSQWMSFFEEVRKCNYEVILLDLGEAVDGIFDILRMCGKIYTPTRDDGVSYAKMEQYEALLRIMEYDDVLEKTRKLSFTYFKGIEYGPEQLVFSELGKYVQKLIDAEEQYHE